ncbi:amidohydrolase [Sporomusaceae bacterium FL31]|nr:amidohydrolase [Sporomusaceae bacterium FL31]GCE32329.1 amidohydrolase [Sporomusaceae bacterium]
MSYHGFADLVLTHGVVYTADDRDTVSEAVAVKDNKVIFVGSDAAVKPYVGEHTTLIDLQGKMLVPGLIDTHMHPPGLSLSELYEVQLANLSSLPEYVAAIRAFIAKHPESKAVYGRGWSWGAFSGEELIKGPRKEYLDAITREIPIILRANDGHSLWVNSKALAVNGVNETTESPAGGVVEKDRQSGALWGVLKESAMWLIALPEYTLSQYETAMLEFQTKMHQFGITSLLCIAGTFAPNILKAFEHLEQSGALALRIRAAMAIHADGDLIEQFSSLGELRKRYQSPSLQIITAKFFTDGVVEGGTSYLLQPYAPGAGKGDEHYGEFLWDEAKLQKAFTMANQQGLQIYVHSTGDASTKKVLDILETIQDRVPSGDYRNTITHLQLVDQDDVPRFKKLQVIASVQPYWHFKGPNWWESVDYRILGERAKTEYPLGTFFAQGVTVTSSSDYPVTNVPYPMRAIDVGVTRNMDNGSFYGVDDIETMGDERYLLNSNERATVQQMLKSFTINGAYAMFMEESIGSIEIGKLADLVVLDQNLLAINPSDIDKVQVEMTFIDGKLVYKRETQA